MPLSTSSAMVFGLTFTIYYVTSIQMHDFLKLDCTGTWNRIKRNLWKPFINYATTTCTVLWEENWRYHWKWIDHHTMSVKWILFTIFHFKNNNSKSSLEDSRACFTIYFTHISRWMFLAMKNCRWFRVEKAIQYPMYRYSIPYFQCGKLYGIIYLVTEEGVLDQSPTARQI